MFCGASRDSPQNVFRYTTGGVVGHEIIEYRKRHMIIHDMDLWTIRHFLLSEAESSANSDLAAFIQSWDWIGPGVYLGIEFDAYFNGDEAREQAFLKLLNATRARIESFGELVPLDYLAANVNLPIAYFTDAQPVGRLVRELAKLDELFTTARPSA